MSSKELNRNQFIRLAVEGSMTVAQAAERLQLSTRRIKQLKKGYRTHGASAMIHGNAQKPSPKRTDPILVAKILHLRQDATLGQSNFTHFQELLSIHHDLTIPYSTLRRILLSHGFCSPKNRRRGHTVHKTRERKPALGIMLQTDATSYDWLGTGENSALHGFIDDATNRVTGAYLCKNECLLGYLEAMRQTLTDYGIPQSIYSDRSSIFFVNSKAKDSLSIREQLGGEEISLTQFGRIMARLGVDMIKAYSPQAKGRVERLWNTFQSRIPIEFALRNLKTVEEANEFLKSYIILFNEKFAVPPADSYSAFVPLPHTEDLDRLLCAVIERKLSSGSTISIQNKRFRIDQQRFPSGTPVTVLLSEKNGIQALVHGQFYPIVPIDRITQAPELVRTGDLPRVVVDLIFHFLLKDGKVA
ncbi:MAG: ISNCY family transposase [Clostridiales bacterium]|nr:ISNCY family transposase [Clostridiales bacterium]